MKIKLLIGLSFVIGLGSGFFIGMKFSNFPTNFSTPSGVTPGSSGRSFSPQAVDEARKICHGDLEKYCPNITNPLQQLQCMRSNEKNLNSDCAKIVSSLPKIPGGGGGSSSNPMANPLIQEVVKKCTKDASVLCPSGSPQERIACMKKNSAKASKDCQEVMKKI